MSQFEIIEGSAYLSEEAQLCSGLPSPLTLVEVDRLFPIAVADRVAAREARSADLDQLKYRSRLLGSMILQMRVVDPTMAISEIRE